MSINDCSGTREPLELDINSSNVTYDGTASPCAIVSLTVGADINTTITEISSVICALKAELAALTLDADDITVTNVTDDSCITPGSTLTATLNDLISVLCTLKTNFEALDLLDVDFHTPITSASCAALGLAASYTNAETLLTALIPKLCTLFNDLNNRDIPINPYVISGIMPQTDASAGGVAQVTTTAGVAWINEHYTILTGQTLPLTSSSDNYVYVDEDTDAYGVSAVAVGGVAPTTNGDVVSIVTTGVGTVLSITQEIKDNLISSTTEIADGIITPAKLDMSSVDNSLNVGGVLKVATEDSLELDVETGKVQLKNDVTTPANGYYYGTNSVTGVKGYHALPTQSLNGASINVAASGGVIATSVNYNIFDIVTTDSIDVETLTVVGTTKYTIAIRNASGSDVVFTNTDNIDITDDITLADGEVMQFVIESGTAYVPTAKLIDKVYVTEIQKSHTQNTDCTLICGANDWFIPTIGEFKFIINNIHTAGIETFTGKYWTSTQSRIGILSRKVTCYDFDAEVWDSGVVISETNKARPMRKFISSQIYALGDLSPSCGWICGIVDNGDATYTYYEIPKADLSTSIVFSNIEYPVDTSAIVGAGLGNTNAIATYAGVTSGACYSAYHSDTSVSLTACEIQNDIDSMATMKFTGGGLQSFADTLDDTISVNCVFQGTGHMNISLYKVSDNTVVGDAYVGFNKASLATVIVIAEPYGVYTDVFDNADTASMFCIYYSAGNLIFKNRLGYEVGYIVSGTDINLI